MTAKRRVGEVRATDEGRDDLAGSHPGSHATTGRRSPRTTRVDAAAAEPAPDAARPDLDSRERRQSKNRKAAGPSKARTETSHPKAPPPTAPPPSDPQ